MALPELVPFVDPYPTPYGCPWRALEMATAAVLAVWRRRSGPQFENLRNTLLRPAGQETTSYPCPLCGLSATVGGQAPDNIIALRQDCPQHCQGIHLTAEDLQVWELDWQKLDRLLCHAFSFKPKFADFGLNNTHQIGSWSADDVPVILTIQREDYDLQHDIAILAGVLYQKFILLAPTSNHLDARSQTILAKAGAAFFPLEANIIITDQGTLHSRKPPGQLFAQFSPQPVDDEQMLRNALTLVKAADTEQAARKVTLYTVMRLYCFDLLEPAGIARTCNCALSLVYNRLNELRQKLGRDPSEFRAYCDQFERIEESLSDPRARHIHRSA